MEEFLKQIQLSENAISIYLNSVGRNPLSSNELHSIIPNASQEVFLSGIEELAVNGLLIPITPQKTGIMPQYLALPPFNPIINYLANINANLDSIKNQLHQLLANSLSKLFKDNRLIELNSILDATQDLRKDIEEETIIQKQEVDDIVQGMENLRVTEKVLDDLHQTIKGVTQTQFSNLLKTISSIKDEVYKGIELLELKKHEMNVKQVIEASFKRNLDKIVESFTENLHSLIEEEFNKTIESLNNIIDSSFQFRDDFKMLLLNTLNGFELKMTTIFDLIKDKNSSLSNDLEQFQNLILDNLDSVIKNSVDSIAALNNPINDVMNAYKDALTPERIELKDIWIVNSILKINEELINLINSSAENLIIILPKLEDHLTEDHFKKMSRNLKIKIASSEAQTNSTVKKLMNIKNLVYRSLKNENIFILKADNNYLIIGVRLDGAKENLNDFIGFGTSYKPIIQLMAPIVDSTWNMATSDLLQAPKSIGITPKEKEKPLPEMKIKPLKFTPTPVKLPNSVKQIQRVQPQQELPVLPTDLTQQQQQHSNFMAKIQPSSKVLDEGGILINSAFDVLIKKLGTLKGEEFSEELQEVADLILENKGFSVTLHQLRSTINKYKERLDLLNPDDIRQIIAQIEEWKKKIL